MQVSAQKFYNNGARAAMRGGRWNNSGHGGSFGPRRGNRMDDSGRNNQNGIGRGRACTVENPNE